MTLEAGAHRHETCVRPAVEEGNAEALGGSDSDVRSELAGGDQQGQRQQVGRDGDEGTAFVGLGDDRRQIADLPRATRVRGDEPEELAVGQRAVQVDGDHLDPDRPGTRAQHVEGLRKGVSVNEDPVRLRRRGALHDHHRLGDRRALVEERRVGRGQTGQVADHRLEVEQRLEPALADLRLVRRVRGVPSRVLEDVAPDHGRGDRPVVPQADHRHRNDIAGRQRGELSGRLRLGGRFW